MCDSVRVLYLLTYLEQGALVGQVARDRGPRAVDDAVHGCALLPRALEQGRHPSHGKARGSTCEGGRGDGGGGLGGGGAGGGGEGGGGDGGGGVVAVAVGAPASAASCVHVSTLPRGSRWSTCRTRAGCSDASGAKQPTSRRTASPTATPPAG